MTGEELAAAAAAVDELRRELPGLPPIQVDLYQDGPGALVAGVRGFYSSKEPGTVHARRGQGPAELRRTIRHEVAHLVMMPGEDQLAERFALGDTGAAAELRAILRRDRETAT